jgi:hypothetical protein
MQYPPWYPDNLKPIMEARLNALRRRYRREDQEIKCIKAQAFAFSESALDVVKTGACKPEWYSDGVKQFVNSLCLDALQTHGISPEWAHFGEFQAESMRRFVDDPKWQMLLEAVAEAAKTAQSPTRAELRRRIIMPMLQKSAMTPTAWAKKAGYAPSIVLDYLHGQSNPRPRTRIDLAQALGIDVSELPP